MQPSPAMPLPTNDHDPSPSTGGCRLVTADGRTLPLRGVKLTASAKGGVARVVLAQRFVNVFAEPLRVTYTMPLPADGAVSGYAFQLGDRRAWSVRSTRSGRRASASSRRSSTGARPGSSKRSAPACSRRSWATCRPAPRSSPSSPSISR